MQSKNFFALLLFALVNIKALLVPLVYLDFELRKEYIIQNLCENRFKPHLKCDGKCYLAKKLGTLAEIHATEAAQKHASQLKKIIEELFEELSFLTFEPAHNMHLSLQFPAMLEVLPSPPHQVLEQPPIA